MRKLYLIRHCEPNRGNVSRCISQSDEYLNDVGREQAKKLGRWLKNYPITAVYSSTLARCIQTAEYMTESMQINQYENSVKNIQIYPCTELTEVFVGEWEGLTFDEIRQKWPREYEERGKHLGTVAPPSGESFIQAGRRLDTALRRILSKSQNDIAVVTHGGIVRGFLCRLLNISPDDLFSIQIPFGSVTEVYWDDADFFVHHVGMKPNQVPGPAEIGALFEKYKTPTEVRRHGQAVAKKALDMANHKNVDKELLYIACLLHDFCRQDGRIHPTKAAGILENAGYRKLAKIVAQHHDLEKDAVPEAELLYLADKMVKGSAIVDLEERFKLSYEKCKDDDSRQAWQKRYDDAKRLMIKYGGNKL